MENNTVMEKIVKSLSFDVEAIPQDNIVQLTSHADNAPLNVKVRVRKKNEGGIIRRGVISVPALDNSERPPDRVRLVSSDQTIISFNILMEADLIKKPVTKPKKFLSFFKSGMCSSSKKNDEEEYTYLPTTSTLSNPKTYSDEEAISDADAKKYKRLFGKCKPGGCLDPPFSEEKYSYEPVSEDIMRQTKITPLNKSEGTNSKSILSLYQCESLNKPVEESDSIITYPSMVQENVSDKKSGKRKSSCDKKSMTSSNDSKEYTEKFFVPIVPLSKTNKRNSKSISNQTDNFYPRSLGESFEYQPKKDNDRSTSTVEDIDNSRMANTSLREERQTQSPDGLNRGQNDILVQSVAESVKLEMYDSPNQTDSQPYAKKDSSQKPTNYLETDAKIGSKLNSQTISKQDYESNKLKDQYFDDEINKTSTEKFISAKYNEPDNFESQLKGNRGSVLYTPMLDNNDTKKNREQFPGGEIMKSSTGRSQQENYNLPGLELGSNINEIFYTPTNEDYNSKQNKDPYPGDEMDGPPTVRSHIENYNKPNDSGLEMKSSKFYSSTIASDEIEAVKTKDQYPGDEIIKFLIGRPENFDRIDNAGLDMANEILMPTAIKQNHVENINKDDDEIIKYSKEKSEIDNHNIIDNGVYEVTSKIENKLYTPIISREDYGEHKDTVPISQQLDNTSNVNFSRKSMETSEMLKMTNKIDDRSLLQDFKVALKEGDKIKDELNNHTISDKNYAVLYDDTFKFNNLSDSEKSLSKIKRRSENKLSLKDSHSKLLGKKSYLVDSESGHDTAEKLTTDKFSKVNENQPSITKTLEASKNPLLSSTPNKYLQSPNENALEETDINSEFKSLLNKRSSVITKEIPLEFNNVALKQNYIRPQVISEPEEKGLLQEEDNYKHNYVARVSQIGVAEPIDQKQYNIGKIYDNYEHSFDGSRKVNFDDMEIEDRQFMISPGDINVKLLEKDRGTYTFTRKIDPSNISYTEDGGLNVNYEVDLPAILNNIEFDKPSNEHKTLKLTATNEKSFTPADKNKFEMQVKFSNTSATNNKAEVIKEASLVDNTSINPHLNFEYIERTEPNKYSEFETKNIQKSEEDVRIKELESNVLDIILKDMGDSINNAANKAINSGLLKTTDISAAGKSSNDLFSTMDKSNGDENTKLVEGSNVKKESTEKAKKTIPQYSISKKVPSTDLNADFKDFNMASKKRSISNENGRLSLKSTTENIVKVIDLKLHKDLKTNSEKNSQLHDEAEGKRKNLYDDSITLDLAFQKNGNIITTLDPGKRYDPYDNVTRITSKLRTQNEIKIPLDSDNDMILQIKPTKIRSTDMKPAATYEKNNVRAYSSDKTKRYEAIQENLKEHDKLQQALNSMHDKELVPLKQVIEYLRKELEAFTAQQLLAKEKVLKVKRCQSLRASNIVKKCGCSKK